MQIQTAYDAHEAEERERKHKEFMIALMKPHEERVRDDYATYGYQTTFGDPRFEVASRVKGLRLVSVNGEQIGKGVAMTERRCALCNCLRKLVCCLAPKVLL